MNTSELLAELKAKTGEVIDLRAAVSVLHWDQEVFMPPKAAPARGRQLATLSSLAHRMFTSEAMGGLLDTLTERLDELAPDDRILVDETSYDYAKATKVPAEFVEKFAEEQSKAYEAWTRARKESDFKTFQPHLDTIVELLRQKAEYLGYEDSPYDALLDEYERDMTAAQVRGIFTPLAEEQSNIIAKIAERGAQGDFGWVDQEYDEAAQLAFTEQVLRDMGYDFDAGRQDKSVHPFTINFDLHDVRVTTRVDPREPFSALTGSIHEGGHALYEQGFAPHDQRTVLAEAISLGIHESQSRMWENMIGRSLPFWQHYHAAFLATHAPRLDGRSAEDLFRAVNRVEPSLIRVEADECTYNLHVVLRFEIEVALIEGTLKVSEVPEAWNAKMKQYLGLDVPDDARGCLQDIHWSHGSMGYFPTYALGNLYAAQLFEQIESDLPALWSSVGAGEFAPLLGWLRANVHRVGRRMLPTQLIAHVTGREPEAAPFLNYLKKKYGGIYGVAL
ncbi:MAG: carboxypeptidase M32 [Candidatus Hydrogenedens sp.]|nr:carboxypeptidase M32 [Candidatus Hydrogenedens sp.]